ncbi:FadR/GntR family transcriptional regulator [Cohnella herbarum]|uniref:FadR family transcriptional regulator n=1 Tax=Cohnella herbarum TaxID=2728023 RepID=A0A7Z2VQJ0_9BACL|nr:FadR/GntR family transcriptional regulator [Cohnella herbarum]QJD87295.1 FadR family transcriptional regulator [Cohnella herbarum]
MAFQKIKTQRGSEIVLQQIREQIQSNLYPPGSKLPTVVELAASFEVGRSTIREALSALKAMGWVTIRHGGGTYVSLQTPGEDGIEPTAYNTELLQEVLEVRKFIEIGCATLAAKRRNDEDLAELKTILDEMEAALDNEGESEQADFRFHLLVANASHNSLLISMMESLTERMQESMKESRRLWFFAERSSAEKLLQEHKEIYGAIEAKNEELAGERMMRHLVKVEKVLYVKAPQGTGE